jgi:hypothetical protein
MAAARRWCVVAGVVAVLLALPGLAGARPARAPHVAVADLLHRVARSAGVGYSGYAESVGGLALPVTADFPELTDLFGDRTRQRIWWRSATEWRADTVTPSGETDAHRDEAGLWTWDYERNRAERVDEPSLRLPRPADLGPADLGRRLLSEARCRPLGSPADPPPGSGSARATR